MSKKYKCTITETYTCSVEIPDDTEETFVEIRKDSLVDEVL